MPQEQLWASEPELPLCSCYGAAPSGCLLPHSKAGGGESLQLWGVHRPFAALLLGPHTKWDLKELQLAPPFPQPPGTGQDTRRNRLYNQLQ